MKEKLTPHIIAVMAFIVFIVLGLASASASNSNALKSNEQESAEEYYERGKRYEERKYWQHAIDEYNKAIKLDPNFFKAYINRARAFAYYGDKKAAEADLNKAIEIDPQNYEPYYIRGLIYKEWGKAEVYSDETTDDKLAKALEYYEHALLDLNKALELNNISDNQQLITGAIVEAKTEKEKIEANIKAKFAKEKALKEAEEAERRAKEEAKKKFIIIPEDFSPEHYTKMDLFKAVSSSKDLRRASTKDESIYNQMLSIFSLGGGNYLLQYVSDLKFVRQNGTDITFSSDDNAITQIMSIDQRSGLQAGQKVRVYYEITRSPLTTWDVIAIERR